MKRLCLAMATVLVLVVVASADAQIVYVNCTYRNGSTACMPSFANMTDSACQSNAAGSGGLQKPPEIVASCGPATLKPGTHTTLVEHVKYSVWHQGSTVWVGPNEDQLLRGETLRQSLVGGQGDTLHGSLQGLTEIQHAPTWELEEATLEGIQKCKAEVPAARQIQAHFSYSARGQENAWRAAASRNEYPAIRRGFHDHESNDDNIVNVLTCFSGPEIQGLIKNLPPQSTFWGVISSIRGMFGYTTLK